jgi:hypothetical protein
MPGSRNNRIDGVVYLLRKFIIANHYRNNNNNQLD